jgi:putative flippase GtrA
MPRLLIRKGSMFDRSFFKFIAVGIINTLIGGALIFFLYNTAHLGYWLSSAGSYAVVSVLSFFLNKYFTFGIKQWSGYMVIAFVFVIAVSYLLAYGIAKPGANYFLRNSPQKTRENIALVIGMCLFTGLNYLGQKYIVFRRKNYDTQ